MNAFYPRLNNETGTFVTAQKFQKPHVESKLDFTYLKFRMKVTAGLASQVDPT